MISAAIGGGSNAMGLFYPFLDDKEVWVGGGRVAQGAGNFEGRFWHSLDGGDTWTKEAVPNLYIISLDMLDDGKHGFSVAMTASDGIELVRYKGPSGAHNGTSALLEATLAA